MNWEEIYKVKRNELKGWRQSNFINLRLFRFRSNFAITKEHFSELEYLILKYDNSTLFRKYEPLLSEEFKSKLLKKRLISIANYRYSYTHYNLFGLLDFYLANPETTNEAIDKHFLNDQILLVLGGFDHKFRRYRWRANKILEILAPKFYKLKPNLRIRIIDLLSLKSNYENTKGINSLIFRNLESIHQECIETYVSTQIKKELVSPKMAIGYLRRFKGLKSSTVSSLRQLVLMFEKGELILKEIDPAPNM